MTTMELNLRKESLIGSIQSMDEEMIGKVESFIERLRKAPMKKEVKPYPWALSDEKLLSVVAESEENYRAGRFIEEEDMDLYIHSLK